eukprot:3462318-Alexandrium_andersonii.AAC.1
MRSAAPLRSRVWQRPQLPPRHAGLDAVGSTAPGPQPIHPIPEAAQPGRVRKRPDPDGCRAHG